jgi:hypothetical protein
MISSLEISHPESFMWFLIPLKVEVTFSRYRPEQALGDPEG